MGQERKIFRVWFVCLVSSTCFLPPCLCPRRLTHRVSQNQGFPALWLLAGLDNEKKDRKSVGRRNVGTEYLFWALPLKVLWSWSSFLRSQFLVRADHSSVGLKPLVLIPTYSLLSPLTGLVLTVYCISPWSMLTPLLLQKISLQLNSLVITYFGYHLLSAGLLTESLFFIF